MTALGLTLLVMAVVLLLAEAHLSTGGLIGACASVAAIAGVVLLLLAASAGAVVVLIVAKSSSVSTIVEDSRATSVPERPIATPMSATRRAGASLTPSPVIAIT
jgi:membrane-bound ClpP family serine protease